MTTSERLAARLRAELPAHGVDIPEGARVCRLYPGLLNGPRLWRWQIARDVSRWPRWVGSDWAMAEVLAAPVWAVTVDEYGWVTVDLPDEVDTAKT